MILGQHADMIAQPPWLDRDIAFKRLADLIHDRAHLQMQRGPLVVSEELAGEAEAERLLPADRHRRQGEGFVGESEPVRLAVVFQRSPLLIPKEVQVPGHRAP